MDSDFYTAYLLHRRPYSDSQVMLDMLVEGVGQLRMLARISGRQATKHKAQLQPFQALLVHYSGKYDLKYINKFELHGNPLYLTKDKLYCGFYLNELTNRIVPVNEPLEQVFELYKTHLENLNTDVDLQSVLRSYEFQLLELLGYGVDFSFDASGEPIVEGQTYSYFPELGFLIQQDTRSGFSGAQLKAIANHDFSQSDVLYMAKQLSRYLLKPLLGNKPLKSRELFMASQ
ncbi:MULTISPECIES: DNA repair protein RecO [unclassified Pseudoalteromonas]|uniref:DNA repair protein RecO n=1 Tax=unclassified Pseudoalteromonas TaxID=194690 RepID=UPI0025732C06|nr:DNA repair protein RecO [Pseudoalteromonas sp. MM1]BED89939.1 DNA repair protein RecO [Pseudoalteromonas sp. MM1]